MYATNGNVACLILEEIWVFYYVEECECKDYVCVSDISPESSSPIDPMLLSSSMPKYLIDVAIESAEEGREGP